MAAHDKYFRYRCVASLLTRNGVGVQCKVEFPVFGDYRGNVGTRDSGTRWTGGKLPYAGGSIALAICTLAIVSAQRGGACHLARWRLNQMLTY